MIGLSSSRSKCSSWPGSVFAMSTNTYFLLVKRLKVLTHYEWGGGSSSCSCCGEGKKCCCKIKSCNPAVIPIRSRKPACDIFKPLFALISVCSGTRRPMQPPATHNIGLLNTWIGLLCKPYRNSTEPKQISAEWWIVLDQSTAATCQYLCGSGPTYISQTHICSHFNDHFENWSSRINRYFVCWIFPF